MYSELVNLTLLGVACGVIANTVSRTKVFRRMRIALYSGLPWVGDLVRCPYCLSHWLAFAATAYYRPRIIESNIPLVDYTVAAFVMIAVASVAGGLVRWAFNGLPPADIDEYEAIQAARLGEST